MSLIGFAVRICMVRALRGATLAGDAVADSPVDPVAFAVKATTPSIAVFTDTESTAVDGGRSLTTGDKHMDVKVHVFLPPNLSMQVDGQEVDFAARRAGAAFVIDLAYRQLACALTTSDGPWARLWRDFVPRVLQVDHAAYVLTVPKEGQVAGARLPAREITVRCATVNEPPFGLEPSGAWARLIEACAASPDTAPFGPLLRGAITGPTLAPAWLAERWLMGETLAEAVDLGYGPLAADPAFWEAGEGGAPPSPGEAAQLAPAQLAEVTFKRGGLAPATLGQAYTLSYGATAAFGLVDP